MPSNFRKNHESSMLFQLEKAAREKKLKRFSSESYKWFMSKVKFIGKDRSRQNLLSDAENTNTIIRPNNFEVGKIYTYVYDAKLKEKLPYWDAFPMIIMVGPAKGGFYGCNLHYLNPRHRAAIFDRLLSITNNKRYDRSTKFALSYQLMQSTSKLDLLKPTFKRYLFSHIKSDFVEIPGSQWQAALFLPTQDFQKASQSKVWKDSAKYV
jgi:hypothetical protein